MTDKVIMPLGWLAGKEIDLPGALQNMVIEMQGHYSDLQEAASRQPPAAADPQKQAGALERYAMALWLIWWQIEDPTQREARITGGLGGWLEIAERLGLALPAELEAQAHKDARKKKRTP